MGRAGLTFHKLCLEIHPDADRTLHEIAVGVTADEGAGAEEIVVGEVEVADAGFGMPVPVGDGYEIQRDRSVERHGE